MKKLAMIIGTGLLTLSSVGVAQAQVQHAESAWSQYREKVVVRKKVVRPAPIYVRPAPVYVSPAPVYVPSVTFGAAPVVQKKVVIRRAPVVRERVIVR